MHAPSATFNALQAEIGISRLWKKGCELSRGTPGLGHGGASDCPPEPSPVFDS